MTIRAPYLMFLGDAPDQLSAKTASGVVHWRPELCLGQLKLDDCHADLGLDDMSLNAAWEAGAKTVVIGVANRGGIISDLWVQTLLNALDLGFDIASGLHNRLRDIKVIVDKADALGRQLTDVRHPTENFSIASGVKRSGKRLLPVGTDCSVGKMYTALAIEREMKNRGFNVDFRATGQTGIFIAGDGVSVDAVVADFISGATEGLSPDNDAEHWDIVEGQGSLFHASFAGVSMGLLHGSQPDALVMCHEPTRTHMRGLPGYALPTIMDCIEMNEHAARLTNSDAKVIGLSVNTHALADASTDYLSKLADTYGMPAVDPVKTGVAALVDAL